MIKLGPNGEEEIWTIKTYITTMDSFPTCLRRSEVSETRVYEVSPSENALLDVEQKTKDLSVVMLRYTTMVKTGQPITTNSLSSALNAAVDGTVTDGILLYRQNFFSPDYINGHPDQVEAIQKLRDAIDEYVSLLHFNILSPLYLTIYKVYVIFECLKLHLALWAYMVAYKTTIGTTPFNLVYGLDAILPIQFLVPILRVARELEWNGHELSDRLEELKRLDEFWLRAVVGMYAQKRRLKQFHNAHIVNKEFQKGDLVLAYTLKQHTSKLKKRGM